MCLSCRSLDGVPGRGFATHQRELCVIRAVIWDTRPVPSGRKLRLSESEQLRNVSFGAYGSGNKPVFTASSTWLLSAGQSFVDLKVSGNNVSEMRGNNGLLLRVDATATGTVSYTAQSGSFFVDSNLSGNSYGLYLDSSCSRLVVKNTIVNRPSSGQHTIRAEHCSRMLIQNSNITGNAAQTGLRITNTAWSLIQGNYMNRVSGFQDTVGESNLNENSIWERNVTDAGGYINAMEINGTANNILIRNSVTTGGTGRGFSTGGTNVWLINNTVYYNTATDDYEGLVCSGSGCE